MVHELILDEIDQKQLHEAAGLKEHMTAGVNAYRENQPVTVPRLLPVPIEPHQRRRPIIVKRIGRPDTSSGGVSLPDDKDLKGKEKVCDAIVLITCPDEPDLVSGDRVLLNPYSGRTISLLTGLDDPKWTASMQEADICYREDIYAVY